MRSAGGRRCWYRGRKGRIPKVVRTDGFTHLACGLQPRVTPIINFDGNVVVFNWQIS